MRRLGLRAEGFEILGRGFAVEGIVWPVVVVSMGEGIEEGLQPVEAMRQVVGGIELVSPCAVAALHRAVQLRALGRQHIEIDPLGLAGSLEVGPELRAAVDLDAGEDRKSVGWGKRGDL